MDLERLKIHNVPLIDILRRLTQPLDGTQLYDLYRPYYQISPYDFAMIYYTVYQDNHWDTPDLLGNLKYFGLLSREQPLINLDTFESLRQNYQAWRINLQGEQIQSQQYQANLDQQMEEADKYVQDNTVSPFKIEHYKLSADIRTSEGILPMTGGPAILNQLEMSLQLVFANYRPLDPTDPEIYKVFYDPTTPQQTNNYQKLIGTNQVPNSLLLATFPEPNNLILVQIDITRSRLQILTSLRTDAIWAKIQEILPNWRYQHLTKTDLEGSFKITNRLQEVLDYATLLDHFSQYADLIGFKETNEPYGIKKTIIFNYQDRNIRFAIHQEFERGHPFLLVRILRAHDHTKQFIDRINRIMALYFQNLPEIREVYRQIVGSTFEQLIPQPVQETAPEQIPTSLSKIERLKETGLSFFSTGQYSRRCGKARQPYVITPEQAEDIQENHVEIEILRYQDHDFICHDPENLEANVDYPYPRLDKPDNPGMICCYKTLKTGKTTRTTTTTMALKGRKILDTGDRGDLPKDLTNLIGEHPGQRLFRMGVLKQNDPNLLIHCVFQALKESVYISKSYPEKITYVEKFRAEVLPRFVDPNVMKQELWDQTAEEIFEVMTNPEVFMDSKWAIRAIEEVFRINLFVFHMWTSTSRQPRFESQIEIPRSDLQYIRNDRPRQAVLILRHRGGEFDQLDRDHYELIVDGTHPGDPISLFPSERFQRIFAAQNEVISWTFENSQLIARRMNQLNIPEVFGNRMTGQIIDAYGKLRGLAYGNLRVFIPPNQPLNLPVVEIEPAERIKYQQAIKIFGRPSSYDLIDQMAIGLWFQLFDIIDGVYVPIQDHPVGNVVIGPTHPMQALGVNETIRINRIIRTAQQLKKVLFYIYSLYPGSLELRDTRSDNVDAFVKRYFILEDSSTDSSEWYDLTELPTEPMPQNLPDTLRILQQKSPSLVQRGKIRIYSEDFYDRMVFMLKQTGVVTPTRVLRNPYETEADFTRQAFTRIFFGTKNIEEWVIGMDTLGDRIYSSIGPDFFEKINPFLFEQDGRIWLVQNSQRHRLEDALRLGQQWRDHQINYGYYYKLEGSLRAARYLVYSLNDQHQLVVSTNATNGQSEFLEVVMFNPHSYGALLPLL